VNEHTANWHVDERRTNCDAARQLAPGLARSLARTAPRLRFTWLLPGHGDRKRLPSNEFTRRLRDLADRTANQRPRPIDFTALRW